MEWEPLSIIRAPRVASRPPKPIRRSGFQMMPDSERNRLISLDKYGLSTYIRGMRMDQFTVKAQEALAAAQTDAEKSDHPEVTTEHLLKALAGQEGGVVPATLAKMGVDSGAVLQEVSQALRGLPHTQGAATQVSPKLDAVLKSALREAEALKDEY